MKNALKVTGLFTFLAVAFLNAFVDLGHKIIIQNTLFKTYTENELIVWTSIVNALILLPFILLFTPTGFVSDKFAKTKVMRIRHRPMAYSKRLPPLAFYWAHFSFQYSLKK